MVCESRARTKRGKVRKPRIFSCDFGFVIEAVDDTAGERSNRQPHLQKRFVRIEFAGLGGAPTVSRNGFHSSRYLGTSCDRSWLPRGWSSAAGITAAATTLSPIRFFCHPCGLLMSIEHAIRCLAVRRCSLTQAYAAVRMPSCRHGGTRKAPGCDSRSRGECTSSPTPSYSCLHPCLCALLRSSLAARRRGTAFRESRTNTLRLAEDPSGHTRSPGIAVCGHGPPMQGMSGVVVR